MTWGLNGKRDTIVLGVGWGVENSPPPFLKCDTVTTSPSST